MAAAVSPRWRASRSAAAWTLLALVLVTAVRLGVERLLWLDPNSVLPPAVPRRAQVFWADGTESIWLSLGSITGLLFGFIAGIRSRSLVGWMLGPSLGITIAVLDYSTCSWLVLAGVPGPQALLVPTAGALAGWVLGWRQPSRRRSSLVLIALVALDGAGRWMAGEAVSARASGAMYPPWWSWLLSTGPLAVGVVLASVRAQRSQTPGDDPRGPGAPWYWIGIGLLLLESGLAAMEAWTHARIVGPRPGMVQAYPAESSWGDEAFLHSLLAPHARQLRSGVSPPGRTFTRLECGFDPERRLGYMLHPLRRMQVMTVGTIPDRHGKPLPVEVLAEPWIRHAALVLALEPADSLDRLPLPGIGSADPTREFQVQLGHRRRRQVLRAEEVERIGASYLAAVARRDAGSPVRTDGMEPIRLRALFERFDSVRVQLGAARRRCASSEAAQLVRAEVDASGIARVLIVPVSSDVWFDGWIARPGERPLVAASLERFWVSADGRPIAGTLESPPDGFPALEWTFAVPSRWIQVRMIGTPDLLVDLGPEAEKFAPRGTGGR